MHLNQVVEKVNAYLAGENLTYNELIIHLDSVIDDLNHELDSIFPAFSEFNSTDYLQYPLYNFFPDRYIRSVVCLGAAFKFFITDEEGAQSAVKYEEQYQTALYMMKRDYSSKVPLEYQAEEHGYLNTPEKEYDPDDIDAGNLHPQYYVTGDPF